MCWLLGRVEDPRSGNAGLHKRRFCGDQGAVDMADFAKAKELFLRGFLKLANGVLSHDTFSRLFRVNSIRSSSMPRSALYGEVR